MIHLMAQIVDSRGVPCEYDNGDRLVRTRERVKANRKKKDRFVSGNNLMLIFIIIISTITMSSIKE